MSFDALVQDFSTADDSILSNVTWTTQKELMLWISLIFLLWNGIILPGDVIMALFSSLHVKNGVFWSPWSVINSELHSAVPCQVGLLRF